MVDIGIIGQYYAEYVFGNAVLATIGLLFILVLLGIRFRWSLDTYVAVLTPFMTVLSGRYLTPELSPIFLFGVGLLIGFGLLALIRR